MIVNIRVTGLQFYTILKSHKNSKQYDLEAVYKFNYLPNQNVGQLFCFKLILTVLLIFSSLKKWSIKKFNKLLKD